MNTTKERIMNIDFLRFVGALIIVYYHINLCMLSSCDNIPLFKNTVNNTLCGGLWADFFFIISGFFLFYTSKSKKDIVEFMYHRIIRFCPIIIITTLIYYCLSLAHLLDFKRYVNILPIFMLNGTGITGLTVPNLHQTWFISALFWTSSFLFYIYHSVKKEVFNIIIALTTFSSIIILNNNTYDPYKVILSFIPIGIIRALFGIGVGYFIFQITMVLNTINIHTKYKNIKNFIINFLEIYLFFYIIYYTSIHSMHYAHAFTNLLIAFILLLILFIQNKGFLSKLLNNKLSVMFGKPTLSIYVVHTLIIDLFIRNLFNKEFSFISQYQELFIILPIILSVVAGIILYKFIEQPTTKYLNKLLLNKRDAAKTLAITEFKYNVGDTRS